MKSIWTKIIALALFLSLIGIILFSMLQKPAPETSLPPTKAFTEEATELPATTEKADPLDGLIYKTDAGLFQINETGEAVQLAECAGEVLSADQKTMYYLKNGNIWRLDLKNCQSKNISKFPKPAAVNLQNWLERPDILFVGLNPEMSAGAPIAYDLVNQTFTYLDGENGWTNSGVSPSSDGIQIALRSNDGPAIFDTHLEKLEILDLSQFGLSQDDFGRFGAPSWSADGSKLAWVVGYENQIGNLILDFSDSRYQILHLYSAVGRGGWPAPALWSPDGNWLVADVWAENRDLYGMVVLSTDGETEFRIGSQFYKPLWSPNSQTLIFRSTDELSSIYSTSVGDWQPELLSLPDGATPIAWPAP